MNMAEKLIALRKSRGWSQEDLAEQLDVSRQSVSKWESGASLPDLDRVLNLSRLFGVSTDYLLRDDLEREPDAVPAAGCADEGEGEDLHAVSEAEAEAYLSLTEQISPRFARAVALCILSPVPLLLLAGLANSRNVPALQENLAGGAGLIALLIMVAIAVRTFITDGLRLSPYDYLEKEELQLSPALYRSVETRMNDFRPTFSSGIAFGVCLCILSVIPLLVAACLEASDLVLVSCVCLLLALVAPAVYRIVRVGMIQGSYQKLLQVADYTPENKRVMPIGGAYWCIVTAAYLAASFYTEAWNRTWIIWPSAGVLFAGLCALVSAIRKRKG